ncbi:MAG: efflux RND transporter periplasmic adaptor subunit [Bacteroidetes bacterium]|nr:efflux RND transporter periplasmic adaptor subunit [Bacteroidota bacterium]MCH8523121.1 efflux RND transporter periplasmic adaptor subunit [Balneolales bacterium]
MKKSTKLILYALIPLVLVGAFVLRSVFIDGNESETAPQTTQRSAQGGGPLSVSGVIIQPEPFSERIITTGNIIANEEVMLRPEVSGRVTELFIQEGNAVKRGDVLLKINDADLRAELLRTRLQLELAEIREARQKALLENRAIAAEDYEVALNQVNTLKAEIELIQARIEKTEIRAPFDGIIGLRNISPGAYITPSDIVVSLQDFDRIRLDFSIPERHAARVRNGDRVEFTRLGTQRRYNARIIAIEPRIDATTRTLSLRAFAENPGREIIPGSFVEVSLELREIPDAMLIPTQALIPELGGASVFIADNGSAQQVRVQSGVRTEDRVQITSGISPGDTVLTSGILQLRNGLPIRVNTGN